MLRWNYFDNGQREHNTQCTGKHSIQLAEKTQCLTHRGNTVNNSHGKHNSKLTEETQYKTHMRETIHNSRMEQYTQLTRAT